ncbi:hypothetical protein FBU31_005768, partial [Coemansia sp. 'formosensis']
MKGTLLSPRRADMPSPTDNQDLDQFDRNQVSIVATLCDHTTCSTSIHSRSMRPKSHTSGTFTDTSSSSSSISSSRPTPTTPAPNPLYYPTDQLFDQPQGNATSADASHAKDGSSSTRAIPPVVAAVAFFVIAVLTWLCIRRRRKRKRNQEGALRLNGGDSSLPATPSSLSDTGGIYLNQSYSSQSSVSLAQSHLQSPMTPSSMSNNAPVEMTQVRRTPTQQSVASSGTDVSSQLTVPMAAAAPHHRPPPPPPSSRHRVPPPLPPRTFQRERADTFSDIPHDDLPPYIDPIEEAMSANSEAEA